MQKELSIFAKKIQVLKKEDKEAFLTRIQKCGTLFDPKNPRDIPECSVDERLGYELDLIRSLYRKLQGEPFETYSDVTYRLANAKKLKEMAEAKARQEIVTNGIQAYFQASEEDKVSFAKMVRRSTFFAPLLRKKDRLWDSI